MHPVDRPVEGLCTRRDVGVRAHAHHEAVAIGVVELEQRQVEPGACRGSAAHRSAEARAARCRALGHHYEQSLAAGVVPGVGARSVHQHLVEHGDGRDLTRTRSDDGERPGALRRLGEPQGAVHDHGAPLTLARREELGLPRPGSDGPLEEVTVIRVLKAVAARRLGVARSDGQVGRAAHRTGHDCPVTNRRSLGLVAQVAQAGYQIVQLVRANNDQVLHVQIRSKSASIVERHVFT